MNESIRIVLPLPKPILSPNKPPASMGGRIGKAKAAKKQKMLVVEAIEDAQLDTMPWARAECRALFYHKVRRSRDSDNAQGSIKSAYDGLRAAGLILDDTPEFLVRTEPELLIDKHDPRLELIVTRLA